jgi:hypothetical protein
MPDFYTYAIYDDGEGLTMSGIPSLAVARAIATDFYRRDTEWHSFIEATLPGKEVVFDFVDEILMFGHDVERFFGSIAIELRCGCCGLVKSRRSVSSRDEGPT